MQVFVINDGNIFVKNVQGRNRGIRLAVNSYLIIDNGTNILIDAGPGRLDLYEKSRYEVETPRNLLKALKNMNLDTSQVNIMINTHLHFDHAGGMLNSDGSAVFSNAKHYISAIEWKRVLASKNHPLSRLLPVLAETAEVFFVENSCSVSENVRIVCAPGHTEGFQYAVADDGTGNGHIFAGDTIPTVWHLNNRNAEGIDFDGISLQTVKNDILDRAVMEGSFIYYQHSSTIKSQIILKNGKYSVKR